MSTIIEDRNSHFFIIPNELIDWIRIIGIGPFSLYCLFKRMCRGNEEIAFPQVRRQDWAEYLGVSLPTFETHLKTLTKYNLIQIIKPKGVERLQHKPYRYILIPPEGWITPKKLQIKPFSGDCRFNDPLLNPEGSLFKKTLVPNTQKIYISGDPKKVGPQYYKTDNYNTVKNNSLCRASADTVKVSKKEIIPEEKQTNPDKKQERLTTRYKQFATRLHEIVTAHRKITRATRPAGWVNSFRLLYERDGIPIKRINAVLEWYADNIGGQYVPEAFSATSFREKFPKLEAAIERNSGKKKPSRQEKKQAASNGAAPVPGKYGETGLYFWNYSNYCYDKDKKKVDTQHFTGWKKHPVQYNYVENPCACDWCKRKGMANLETITLTGGPHNDMEFQAYMERIEKENE